MNGKKKGQYSKAVSKKTNDLLKAARDEAAKAKKDLEAAKAAKEADLDDVSRQAEQMVGGEGADELIIPKANTTAKKTDMYKGKKKQSRKSRKQNK